jgi:electron transfer flavoprotein alpha subunit
MSKILVIAEHDGAKLNASTPKSVTCAAKIAGATIDVAVLAADASAVAPLAAAIAGVSKVLVVENPANKEPLAAVFAPQIAKLAAGYTHVFGPSTTFGKDLMPRVAALLGVSAVTDIMAVEGSHTFKRPIYAGNAILTVEVPAGAPVVATVRVASFEAAGQGGSAAVDAGYVQNDLQIGQTGKIIAPELYFAIGISGAIQHMTGIKDARTIVAINKDGEAPIFESADIGLVGDLFSIVPELEKALG